jgi:hypothetical protein
MRFMDGSQWKLALGLAVGLCAFWLVAPPTTNVNGDTLGGWVGAWYEWKWVAATTGIGGDMHDFSEVTSQPCEWYWQGSTFCWGGYIMVGTPSWTGRPIAVLDSTPCTGSACNTIRDAGTL